jgi:hypothetical protein
VAEQAGLSPYMLPQRAVPVAAAALPSAVGMPTNAVLQSTVLVPAQPVVPSTVLTITGQSPVAAGSGSTLQLGAASTLSRQGSVSSQLNGLPTQGVLGNAQSGIPGIPSADPSTGPLPLGVDASLMSDHGAAQPESANQWLVFGQDMKERAETLRERGPSHPNSELQAEMYEIKAESNFKAAQSKKLYEEARDHHQAEVCSSVLSVLLTAHLLQWTCH